MDEKLITGLIERWVAAIRAGDLPGVLADHTDDIVMYDVPAPDEGVRGLAAYRETWPPFFAWLASGAVFELDSTEVTAGADVAFAGLLLRCGDPGDVRRLRITVGLRKRERRWLIAHEHHSFPIAPPAEPEIRELHERWYAATAARDLDALMAGVADDVVSYEHVPPLQHTGVDAVREVCRSGLEAGGDAAVDWRVPDLTVVAADDLAVSWGLDRIRTPDGETWSRGTRVFRRTNGSWAMVHQHLSFPADPGTGATRTDLTPSI